MESVIIILMNAFVKMDLLVMELNFVYQIGILLNVFSFKKNINNYFSWDCVARGNALCSLSADCINRRCVCRPGYTGDGITCMKSYLSIEQHNNCSNCHCKATCDVASQKCVCNVRTFIIFIN